MLINNVNSLKKKQLYNISLNLISIKLIIQIIMMQLSKQFLRISLFIQQQIILRSQSILIIVLQFKKFHRILLTSNPICIINLKILAFLCYQVLMKRISTSLVSTKYGEFRLITFQIKCNQFLLQESDEVSINFNDRFISGFSSGQFLFLVNPNNGVYAYSVNMKYQIGLFEKINTSAGKNKIHGVDVFMSKQKFLYVLDQVQNIYVYKLQGKSFFLYDIIQIKHEQNFKIQVVENTIFYSFIEKDIDMICELYYNPTKKVAELVRYYKLFQRINQFFINSKQLFVLSQEGLDIFPINIDPRIIKRQHNGYKIDINANQIIKLTESQYLIHSKKKMKIARLIRKNPKISCHFSNLHQKIYINYKVNLSDCKNHPVMILNQNITYNSYCAFEKNIILDIDIPQIKQRKNIVVYGITIFVVILCILGVIFLFYWRHTRLNIIQRIKKQVNEIKFEKFKNQEEINQPNQLQDNLKTQQVMKKQSE